MKNKTKIIVIIIAMFALILITGCVKDNCRDGICQPLEERNGSCPEDCEKTSPFESPVKEDLCIVKSIEAIGEGAFPQWSAKNNLIAFNKKVKGIHEIFIMKIDGSDVKCLTCGKSELPLKGHNGQPAWHISGDYIVFTVENTDYPKLRLGLNAYPDSGRNHNVWIMTSDGNNFWQMTDYEENWGVIRPRFSSDGEMLFWSEEWGMEKYPGTGSVWSVSKNPKEEMLGLWRIGIADISFSSCVPTLSDQRTVYHEELSLLEGSGFTPNGKKIHFSSAPLADTEGIAFWGEIYISDLDGKNKYRLTYFHNNLTNEKQRCNEFTWNPDGKQIALAFGKGDNQFEEISTIYMLSFEGACGNFK